MSGITDLRIQCSLTYTFSMLVWFNILKLSSGSNKDTLVLIVSSSWSYVLIIKSFTAYTQTNISEKSLKLIIWQETESEIGFLIL